MFRLLIPLWYEVPIRAPLHFPEDLYPLRIEGQKGQKIKLVQFYLPAAPTVLLHDVDKILDPNHFNSRATTIAGVTTAFGAGRGVNGA
jgi:hypothetical protein